MSATPFRADLQTRRHRDRLREALQRETAKIEAVREVRGRAMSVLEKMALVAQKRADLNKSLDARAQELLERYEEADRRADEAFTKHGSRLDAEIRAADELDHAIEQMSNGDNLGNLSNG